MLLSGLLALLALDLSPQTAARLQVAWTYHTARSGPQRSGRAHCCIRSDTSALQRPAVRHHALQPGDRARPGTGRERWRFDPKVAADRSYSEATSRGVTPAGGRLFFGTLDARLIALNAATGRLEWETRLSQSDGNFQVTSPPVVVGDTVITGSSIGDNGAAELDRGTVRAYDVRNGKLRWTWDPTPQGRTGAANAWAPISADSKRGLVFVPTGSASPDFYGGLRPGPDLYANCVVALRASTGKVVWSFQVVHHDLWDYDVASRPELIEFKGRPAVAVLTKIGHYFALDRETGQPLLPVVERPAPKSDVEGESASPTQPFPASGVFTSQQFVPRPGWCSEQFQQLRYDGLFTPPSLRGTLLFPGNVGGANWGSGAYDPSRGLLVVAANRLATAVRLIPRAVYDSAGNGETGERWGQEYAAQAGTPYGMSRKTFLGPDGRPCNQEPWGALAAIDVETGKLRWETPMLVSLGGPLAVNGVVFFGGTVFETKLRAYAIDDGRKLWETDLPYSAHSVPGAYVWKGKRYIVVCAGGHGKVDGSKLGDAVIAFVVE